MDKSEKGDLMTVGAIIQARMGSKRFPGKMMRLIDGKPMLWHVVRRVRQAKSVNTVIVATSQKTADKAIIKFCRHHKILSWSGSEEDVLERYWQAAGHYDLDHIIRITGDQPLIDPEIVDQVVRLHRKKACDYTATAWGRAREYPLGFDVRVMSWSALERAYRLGKSPMDREHVTWYIHRNRQRFKIAIYECPFHLKRPQYHLAVNTLQEMKLIRGIYALGRKKRIKLTASNIIKLLDADPTLQELNRKIRASYA